jgi:gas vesicle protein
MNTGKVLLGVLAGVATGALLGILFAPEKGTKTRRKIMESGDDYVDELKSKFDDLVNSISHKFESSKKDAEMMLANGKSKVDHAMKNTNV